MEDKTYAWVSPGSLHKYNRARAQLKKEQKEVTEEAIKELYVKWGGLLLEVKEPKVVEEKPVVKQSIFNAK